jgi:putative transposase
MRSAQRTLPHLSHICLRYTWLGMSDYRRAHIPGGTFFFTLVTENRAPILCGQLARTELRRAFRTCRERWPFAVDALVLLPDHMHTIWSFPPGDADFSRRLAFIKKEFTKRWLLAGGTEQPRTESRRRHGRRGVWQRRFWEHAIRDGDDLMRHVEYIHHNPVKHGLVTCPHAWPYSTFHRWVRTGAYPSDWACTCNGASPRSAHHPNTVRTADPTRSLRTRNP